MRKIVYNHSMQKRALSAFILVCVLITSLGVISTGHAQSESGLTIWYLDVGEGTAAVVQCDGYNMLIDGGPSKASDYVYSFLKAHDIKRFEYVVASHPDADHIGGIAGALNYATAGVAFCTVLEYDTKTFSSFLRYLTKGGGKIIVPQAGDVFSLGTASVQILGPGRGQTYSGNTSIVLRVVYGNTSFLFTGDSEWPDEEALCASGYTLDSDVLAVGHHGSSSSTSAHFLQEVSPDHAVISVGKNKYGHPAEEVLKKLSIAGCAVYRTDESGNITCRSDGEKISFSTERGKYTPFLEPASPAPPPQTATRAEDTGEHGKPTYIGNANSHKFHKPSCSSVKQMADKNKVFFYGDRSEPVSQGYDPCKRCRP